MGVFFVYILKSAFCLAAFYLFYRLLLSRDTFHRFNRVMLLSLMLLSCLLPFVEVTMRHPTEVNRSFLTMEQLIMMQYAGGYGPVSIEADSGVVWNEVILLIYWGGILFFLLRNVWALRKMFQLITSGKKLKEADGTNLIVHKQKVAPFSWMKYIVISQKDLDENGTEIMIHEKAHIANGHSWDVLLADLFVFLQWFNPAAWLLKQELQNIHEYEADDTVLRKGIDAKSYQLLLIEKAVGPRLYSIANSFNHSSLKKRIAMMLKEKSNPWARLKYLYVLPVAVLTVAAFARPEVSNKLDGLSAVKVTDLSSMVKEQTTKIEKNVLPENIEEKAPVSTQTNDNKEVTVKGVITDIDKNPVKGASVVIRNSTVGTIADNNGRFVLKTHDGDVVCVSFIGKQTVLLPIKSSMNGKEVHLTLLDEVKPMDEVVVVGYANDMEQNVTKNELKDKQTVSDKNNVVFTVVEEMPEFPGGMQECLKFLARNVKYPVDAQKAGIQGRVIVQFTVKSDGSISDTKVVRSISPSLDEEAVRVINMMPKWKPGYQRGTAVNVKYTLPIIFSLQKKEASAQPLVILDGQLLKNADLNSLNASSIDNISVIKGGTDLAPYINKYGSIAKNGVVIVTSKK